MWPSMLAGLPELPGELEYRFLGRNLLIIDVLANLVVDVLDDALPAPEVSFVIRRKHVRLLPTSNTQFPKTSCRLGVGIWELGADVRPWRETSRSLKPVV